MEKAIFLLSKVNESNFIDLFYVTQRLCTGFYSIESIMFLDKDDAQRHCDYLNHMRNTTVYLVSRTSVHV